MKKLLAACFAIILIAAVGCKKFIDVNDNPNLPTDVGESLILSPLELDVAQSLSTGFGFSISNHFMQTVALNQPVPNNGTYLLFNGDMDGDWANLYTTLMNNLKVMIDKAEAGGNTNYAGIGHILTAFALGVGTDYWGDVPYTEALQGISNIRPGYDAQEQIYVGIQTLLDKGISEMATATGKAPGSDDFFYSGDLEKWTKLAYTLKARFYMHLTKAPGHTAVAQAALALTALQNGMGSNDDDFKFAYPGSAGQQNPIYTTFLPVSTLVLSEKLVNGYKSRNDPRLPLVVAPAPATGLYTGRPIGDANVGSLEDYSVPGPFYGSPDSYVYVVNYTEALFLKAEATFYISGAAAASIVYQEAVRQNMAKLGVSNAAATTYITGRGALTAGNAVQLIVEEKQIANFLSLENFNDWRRTGFPVLTAVPNALSAIPRRFLYPQSEIIANPRPQQAAVLTDRVWWDAP